MAEEPTDLVLRMLRDIRTMQEEHGRRFDQIDRRVELLGKKIDDWSESTAMAVGLASHANVRANHIDEEIADLKRRIERLEGATPPAGH